MRQSRRTVALAGAVAAVVVGMSGCSSDDGNGGGGAAEAAGAEQTAADFLTAWADGDTEAAAALTDDPEAAAAALTEFAEGAGVSELSATPGPATGADGAATEVPFEVTARVTYEDDASDWLYDSALTVVRQAADGDGDEGSDGDEAEDGGESVRIRWSPEILHPRLTEGRTLEVGPGAGPPPVTALDRNGDALNPDEHPTLKPLLEQLAAAHGEQAGGSPGAELRLTGGTDAEGNDDDNSEDGDAEDGDEVLLELAEPTRGEVPTTIDPELQRIAEKTLEDSDRSALVAIQPSTGAILAVVNNPGDDENIALEGRLAPGSTWKIITAGMLIDAGLADPAAPHPCPKKFEFEDWPFQNLDEFEIKGGTFTQSFAASCNTAFISAAPELEDDQLTRYAERVFGIGLEWDTGVEAMTGYLAEESKAQMAAQLIGQASVRANPLVMASVSATVKDGTFRQPFLVPPSFDDRELVTADGPSDGTAAQLRALMATTAAAGTAAEAMAGVEGDVGAKTGSAEVFEQKKPNAWFTAYRDDLAVAAVVRESGHGGKFAGPLVAEVLRSAGGAGDD
ncbi:MULTISPECIES: penicillin-binding transpeptidase domain-containing protein [unclassified Streptomyces]|uniref:penicillin-binding transpeptidase domain-containing protein n=1 Tax=unclassified Streptomyces TaxID=2593676 RepID=UPI000CD5B529|nr:MULTISPECIES: penicillin-binding transpeptidase domain-containing protein [unclassified Streptomyces]